MGNRRNVGFVLALAVLGFNPPITSAQTIGTFRWQLQPFCNTLTLTVTQAGGFYTLDGVDDLCGAPASATVVGIAFPTAGGAVGIGLTVVLPGGAAPLHVSASIQLANLSGTWEDSAGHSGALVFNPSTPAGSPRPLPRALFLAGLSAGNSTISDVAPPVNGSDAATKQYVDVTADAAARAAALHVTVHIDAFDTVHVWDTSPALIGTTAFREPVHPPAPGRFCVRLPAAFASNRGPVIATLEQTFNTPGLSGFVSVFNVVNHFCPVPTDIAVQTFNQLGEQGDRSFTLLIPRR